MPRPANGTYLVCPACRQLFYCRPSELKRKRVYCTRECSDESRGHRMTVKRRQERDLKRELKLAGFAIHRPGWKPLYTKCRGLGHDEETCIWVVRKILTKRKGCG